MILQSGSNGHINIISGDGVLSSGDLRLSSGTTREGTTGNVMISSGASVSGLSLIHI